jgi:hypothetical protein
MKLAFLHYGVAKFISKEANILPRVGDFVDLDLTWPRKSLYYQVNSVILYPQDEKYKGYDAIIGIE